MFFVFNALDLLELFVVF